MNLTNIDFGSIKNILVFSLGVNMFICSIFILSLNILAMFDSSITAWVVIVDIWCAITIIVIAAMKRSGKIDF